MNYNNFVATNQLFSLRKNTFYSLCLLIIGSLINLSLFFNLLNTRNPHTTANPTGVFNVLGKNVYDLVSVELNTQNNLIPSTALLTTKPIAALLPNNANTITNTINIKHGTTFHQIAKKLNLPESEISDILKLPAAKVLTELKVGETLSLELDYDHSIIKLSYPINSDQTLIISRDGQQFISNIIGTIAVSSKILAQELFVDNHFHENLQKFLSYSSIDELENMLHTQQVIASIQHGDKISFIYQQYYDHQKETHSGDVLVAQIHSPTQNVTIFRYTLNGQTNLYLADGESLEPAFLRAPLHYTYISSPFNLHRMQPILHIIRPHYGVDFAAPPGTPIEASSNGTIEFIGQKNGFGNVIDLKYNDIYSTVYAHLARFASDIHDGTVVHEGETIGYVGMTGLATGPHLHYEFHVHGIPVNPMSVKLPGADSLTGNEKIQFLNFTKPLLQKLNIYDK